MTTVERICQTVEEHWREVLGWSDHASDEQEFFASGGDSLTAIELLTRLEGSFGREVDLGDFFADSRLGTLKQIIVEGAEVSS